MVSYLEEVFKSMLEGFEGQERVSKLFSKCTISKDQTRDELEEKLAKYTEKPTLPPTVGLPYCLIVSTDGHLYAQSHQEGTSDPTRMNLNETLRSMQQSIEGLARQFQSFARDVEELKKGKSSATVEQRRWKKRSPEGRGYHRPQEKFPRYEAWHEDNLYEDYGDNPNVGLNSRTNIFKGGADNVNRTSQSLLEAKSGPITRSQRRKLNALEDNGIVAYLEEALKSMLEAYLTADGRPYPTIVGRFPDGQPIEHCTYRRHVDEYIEFN
ncbi:hypothetical protein M9H77_03222 [Catharanthus roseus]|uniref:Uncharacterized protein n=1 Tax=Catharanthus roseus TaxID=4058 RepID=A0ACC0CAK3_CATRO|nr:hypothetical protein M9H77_03222 [Catharanthus roseus]